MSSHGTSSSISLQYASLSFFESVVNFTCTKGGCYAPSGIIILFVEVVPTWRLRELCDNGEQYDVVYFHGDDESSPRALAFLSEVVR
jgi:hypothetical protein